MSRLRAHPRRLEGLKRALAAAPQTDNTAFEQIVTWLANLRLLYGVPFWYLTPDGRMLPPESIKFFQVNQNWIDCLIDGAYSIGRSTSGDAGRDQAIRQELHAKVAAAARQIRARKFGLPAPAPDESAGYSSTGFLLRSGVVSGWPGLTVTASSGGTPVNKARFETVAPSVLLCLFDGPVDTVTFSEPVEILHFGLNEPVGDGPYTKTLRYVIASGDNAPGTQMSQSVNVPLTQQRVIDATGLAGQVQSALIAAGGMDSGTTYTAAELALELVEGVQQVTFTLSGGEE